MTKQKKLELLSILADSTVKISLNQPVKDNMGNIHEVLIHECSASLVERLVKAGYSLFMTDKGLSVDCFKL